MLKGIHGAKVMDRMKNEHIRKEVRSVMTDDKNEEDVFEVVRLYKCRESGALNGLRQNCCILHLSCLNGEIFGQAVAHACLVPF